MSKNKVVIQMKGQRGDATIFRKVHLLTARGSFDSLNANFEDQNDILHLFDMGYLCFGGISAIGLGENRFELGNEIVEKACHVLSSLTRLR